LTGVTGGIVFAGFLQAVEASRRSFAALVCLLPATVAVVASVFISSAAGDGLSPGFLLSARKARGAPTPRSGGLHLRLVSELMRRTNDVVRSDAPIADVLRELKRCRDDILVVIDAKSRRVSGVVNPDHVKELLGQEESVTGTAFDVMITPPPLREDEPLT